MSPMNTYYYARSSTVVPSYSCTCRYLFEYMYGHAAVTDWPKRDMRYADHEDYEMTN